MILVKDAMIRGAIPFIIMTGISFIMKIQNMEEFQVKSTFITGLILTAVAATSVLYEIKSWTLTKQSVIHFVVMLVTVFPCLLFSGWFSIRGILDVLKILGIFLLTGVILWLLAYLIFAKILKN
mgnify:CR=1 FL=1|jgi:hypothetical protein